MRRAGAHRHHLRDAHRPNRPATARVRGRFALHGVTHEVTVPVTVLLIPLSGEYAGMEGIGINADMLRVQGEFHPAR